MIQNKSLEDDVVDDEDEDEDEDMNMNKVAESRYHLSPLKTIGHLVSSS
jgi:hypothetical protein